MFEINFITVNSFEEINITKPIFKENYETIQNLFQTYNFSSISLRIYEKYKEKNLIWDILRDSKGLKFIKISYESIKDQEFETFLSILEENPSIEKVDFDGSYTEKQLKRFSSFLAKNQTIRNLEIGSQLFNPLFEGFCLNNFMKRLTCYGRQFSSNMEFIEKLLEKNLNLEYLHIPFLKGDLGKLGKILIENQTLKTLKIDDLEKCTGYGTFLQSISKNKGLKSLQILQQNEDNYDKYWCEFLSTNSTLEILNLTNNAIQNGSLIAESLKKNHSLTKLSLNYNLQTYQLESIFKASTSLKYLSIIANLNDPFQGNFDGFKGNQNLEELVLNNNTLQGKGLKSLVDILKTIPNFKKLDIEGIETSYNDHFCIKELIVDCKSLEKLNISMNKISTKEIAEIIKVLQETDRLKSFNISYIDIEEEICEMFGEYFSKTKRLEEIYLNYNDIKDQGLKHLNEGIENNKSIKILDLIMNRFTIKGIESIKESLFYNQSLTRLSLNSMDNFPLKHESLFKFINCYLYRNYKLTKTFKIECLKDLTFQFESVEDQEQKYFDGKNEKKRKIEQI